MENACETYYQNANLSLGVVYINFLIANCLEGKGEISGIVEKGGVDELLQVLTEEYLADSLEVNHYTYTSIISFVVFADANPSQSF